MGSFGGFYKGEKKKPKQNKKGNAQIVANKPVFVLPKKIEKQKKDW